MRQMFPRLSLIAGLALVSSPATVLAQQSSEISTTRLLDNTLNQYCVVCHNDALLTADMSLEGVTAAELAECRSHRIQSDSNLSPG